MHTNGLLHTLTHRPIATK